MHIAIIGAGYAGLAAAHDLAKAGHRVTIFEAQSRAGGLAMGFKAPHWEWPLEQFYHHLFTNDEAILDFADEIGAGAILHRYRPSTVMVHQGKLYPFDGPLALLRYPALSFVEKMRIGLTALYLKRQTNWRPLERVTAHDWLRRWMGEAAYRKSWEPLLLGKFGERYRDVPMSWFWARIYKRTPALIYPDGGFDALTDAMVRAVERLGGTLHYESPVQTLRPLPDGWEVTAPGTSGRFDRVIATVPPGLMAKLAPQLPDNYLASLKGLNSMGAVVLVVALSQRLTEHSYWINLDKRKYPMLALVEHTNMVDPSHYGNDHLIYMGDYLPPDHPYLQYDEEVLFELYEPVLQAFNPHYDRSWVRDKWRFSVPYAQPIPPLRYSEQIPPLRTPLPGLYFASMSQVYPWDRGTNYAVEMGRRVAAEVLQETENVTPATALT